MQMPPFPHNHIRQDIVYVLPLGDPKFVGVRFTVTFFQGRQCNHPYVASYSGDREDGRDGILTNCQFSLNEKGEKDKEVILVPLDHQRFPAHEPIHVIADFKFPDNRFQDGYQNMRFEDDIFDMEGGTIQSQIIVNAIKGNTGHSAYELAVLHGFEGTEPEWLASLKGEQGEQGIQGIQGIKGDKGDKGDRGEKGDQGERGLQGERGEKGEQGERGEKGEKGDKGERGEQGFQGVKGDCGADGQPAIIESVEAVTVAPDHKASARNVGTPQNARFIFEIPKGEKGDTTLLDKITISEDGYWVINGEKTTQQAQGKQGTPFTFDDLTPEQKAELKGEKGDKGDKGDRGCDGRNGRDGRDGSDGVDGRNGIDGRNGTDGHSATIEGVRLVVLPFGHHGKAYNEGTCEKARFVFEIPEGRPGKTTLLDHITISEDGYWVINGHKTSQKAQGEKGEPIKFSDLTSEQKAELKGEKGETGERGEKGETGERGADGRNGKDGHHGRDGLTPFIGGNLNWWIGCTDTGIRAAGAKGRDGRDGKDGADGKDGKDGVVSEEQIQQITAQVTAKILELLGITPERLLDEDINTLPELYDFVQGLKNNKTLVGVVEDKTQETIDNQPYATDEDIDKLFPELDEDEGEHTEGEPNEGE